MRLSTWDSGGRPPAGGPPAGGPSAGVALMRSTLARRKARHRLTPSWKELHSSEDVGTLQTSWEGVVGVDGKGCSGVSRVLPPSSGKESGGCTGLTRDWETSWS